MSLETLQIIFHNPNAIFRPGQTITGQVLILASGLVKIRSVKLTFKGKASVSWIEKENRKKNNGETEIISNKYHGEEKYFKNITYLTGGKGISHLTVGEHVYPFNFSLPHKVPSTFTSEYGCVRYEAKVKIDVPGGFDKMVRRSFKVAPMINLNLIPSLAEPKTNVIEKFYCCFFCKSGPMTLVLYVPYSGFVPGQIIPVTIEIDNNSNVNIKAINVQLKRSLKFKSKGPRREIKSCSSVLAVLALQGVEAHSSRTNTHEITVPKSLSLHDLSHCGIISEDYELNAVALSSGMHMKTKVSLALTMGHVPLSLARFVPEYKCPNQ